MLKLILKFIQFLLKFLASLFSKIGAQYTYIKIFKYLMKIKLIKLLYEPLKYLFTNCLWFLKLASVILAVLSLFNLTLFYFHFDVIEEVNEILSNIIKFFNKLLIKWGFIEEEIETPEPVNFLKHRREIKLIEKTVEKTSSFWLNLAIITAMIVGGAVIVTIHPDPNDLKPYVDPIFSKIDSLFPENFPTTFVSGMFIYKFFSLCLTYIKGDKPSNPDDKQDWDQDGLSLEERLRLIDQDNGYKEHGRRLAKFHAKMKDIRENRGPLLTEEDREYYYGEMMKDLEKPSKITVESPKLSPTSQADIDEYFRKVDETPKASSSKLPDVSETITAQSPIVNLENPFKKITSMDTPDRKIRDLGKGTNEIKIEDWV